ncbi:hypothetical protein [Ferruginibacter sp.]
MRLSFFLLLPAVLVCNCLQAQQSNSVDTAFTSYFDRLPGVLTSAEEAWKLYTPKNSKPATKQYEAEIMVQLNILADHSDRKSYILSWYTDRLEKESKQYRHTDAKVQKDPVLEKAVKEAITDYFSMLDNYLRTVNYSIDTLFKKYTGRTLAEKELQLYQKELPQLYSKTKAIFSKVHQMMRSKGYNTVLQQGNTQHPYYIQLLEARGQLLDKLRELNKQADAANATAAQLVEFCKKDPETCK